LDPGETPPDLILTRIVWSRGSADTVEVLFVALVAVVAFVSSRRTA